MIKENALLPFLPMILTETDNSEQAFEEDKVDEILSESLKQAVYLQVFSIAKKHSTNSVGKKWQELYYQIISKNAQNQSAHKELHKILTEAGIPYVVIKGMASAFYYSNPLSRTMGDIDFLVSIENRDEAAKSLISHGKKRCDDNTHSFHWSFIDNNSWELHWMLPGVPEEGICRDRILSMFEDIFEKSELYDGYKIPSAFHHGLILLLHMASHLTSGGIGLRHLCDWAVFVKRFDSDVFVQSFEKAYKHIGVWEFARVVTAVSMRYLGIEEKEFAQNVDVDTIDSFMDDILSGGNFGVKDNQRLNQAKFLRNDISRQVTTNKMFKNVIDNINLRVKREYPRLRKNRFLLPVGWTVLGTKQVLNIITKKRSTVNLVKSYNGAIKRGTLYSRLKLFEIE